MRCIAKEIEALGDEYLTVAGRKQTCRKQGCTKWTDKNDVSAYFYADVTWKRRGSKPE